MFDEIQLNFWTRSGAKVCKSCRSRQELSIAQWTAVRCFIKNPLRMYLIRYFPSFIFFFFRLYFVPYFLFSCMFPFSTSIFECRRILNSNEYSLAKIRFDTAENEPLKVCQKIAKVRKEVRTIIALPRGEAAKIHRQRQ